MQLTITSVDYAPEELHDQVPFSAQLLREIPGDDRPDYWIAKLDRPLRWLQQDQEVEVTHLVLAARWVGTRIAPGAQHLPVGIAFVTDSTILSDERLDFAKSAYVAIGIAEDSSGGRRAQPPRAGLAGRIGNFFGRGSST